MNPPRVGRCWEHRVHKEGEYPMLGVPLGSDRGRTSISRSTIYGHRRQLAIMLGLRPRKVPSLS